MNNDHHLSSRLVFNRLFPAAAVLVCATSLQAHPGHGLFEQGPLHTITSPYHLAVLALTGCALFVGAHFIRQQMPRRAAQLVGTTAVVLSAVLWGLRV